MKQKQKKNSRDAVRITITKDGKLVVSWWTPQIDKLLNKIGVNKSSVNRNPWCG